MAGACLCLLNTEIKATRHHDGLFSFLNTLLLRDTGTWLSEGSFCAMVSAPRPSAHHSLYLFFQSSPPCRGCSRVVLHLIFLCLHPILFNNFSLAIRIYSSQMVTSDLLSHASGVNSHLCFVGFIFCIVLELLPTF